jgi:dTDP-glucose 4,6-dehydratase
LGPKADINRVLITGAAGFLGSHLCDRFIAAGWHVVGVDNLLTGTKENLTHLGGHPRFTFTKHDVSTPFFSNDPVHLVLHFASPASPKDYLRYPIHTLKVDALGTLHTLGLARTHGARYVLASTSEVYGDPQVHPQPESYWGHVNPIGPRSVYDEAKRFAEALALAYHRSHAIDVRIARIFNTYGPRMRLDDGRAIPTFIVKALLGEPLPVQGDGRQTRSFCYVDDLMEGIYRLATIDGLAGEVVNLGNPDEHTVADLAEIVRRLTGRDVPIAHVPLPTDDPKRRCPEISKARARLEWSPSVSLSDGLVQTIDWFAHSLVAGESEALGVSGVGG